MDINMTKFDLSDLPINPPSTLIHKLYKLRFILPLTTTILAVITYLINQNASLLYAALFISGAIYYKFVNDFYNKDVITSWALNKSYLVDRNPNKEILDRLQCPPFRPINETSKFMALEIKYADSYAGDVRDRATITIKGQVDENQFTAFELLQYYGHGKDERKEKFNIVIFNIPDIKGQVVLRKENNIWDKSFKDINLESTTFNKNYILEGSNQRLAVDLMDAQTIDYFNNLLINEDRESVSDKYLWDRTNFAIITKKPLTVAQIESKLARASRIITLLPKHLTE